MDFFIFLKINNYSLLISNDVYTPDLDSVFSEPIFIQNNILDSMHFKKVYSRNNLIKILNIKLNFHHKY